MSNEMVKIGRRTVSVDVFESAVEKSKSSKEVCLNLGFNETVGTTKAAIMKAIDELGINIDHFRKLYNVSDKVMDSRKRKQFQLNADNKKYFAEFQKYIDDSSWGTYKATLGNFLESLEDKDFASASVDEIVNFAGDSKNKLSHFKSLIDFLVSKNLNNFNAKVDKSILIWRIEKDLQDEQVKIDPVYADEIDAENNTRIEGKRVFKEINVYERDAANRNKCLDYYKRNGLTCSVCKEDLGHKYGDVFSDKIHIHHLNPLYIRNEEHEVDPIKDLQPVCPNCHMIIHCKKDGFYTIDEVKDFILSQKNEDADL